MLRRKLSPKLAITVDPDIHENILAAAARDRVRGSAWMTTAAREALKRRAGLAAVERWEKQQGRSTSEDMTEARRSGERSCEREQSGARHEHGRLRRCRSCGRRQKRAASVG
jgi:hypothetical protein